LGRRGDPEFRGVEIRRIEYGDTVVSVRNERGMEEAETQLKHRHRVYCAGRSPVKGDPSKRIRANCYTQAWARNRGLVEKYEKGYHCWATKKNELWLGHCSTALAPIQR
jgi:hypothetical protein